MSTSLTRIITLCMLISLAISTPTFNNPIINTVRNSPTGTTRSATQGILVSLTGPGWIVSDEIGIPDTTVFTPTTLNGNLGVGIAVADTGATPCTGTRTQANYLSNPIGTATTTVQCPADFLTIYNVLPTGTTQTTISLQNIQLNTGTSYSWALTTAPTAACVGLAVTVGATSTFATTGNTTTISTPGICSNTSSSGDAKANYTYAYYVEAIQTNAVTRPTASVCFQTPAQFAANPGNCGAVLSAGVLSAVGSIIATITLFFLN